MVPYLHIHAPNPISVLAATVVYIENFSEICINATSLRNKFHKKTSKR